MRGLPSIKVARVFVLKVCWSRSWLAIQTGAFTLSGVSKDAAVLITLNPGAYTAQIKSAKNASSGLALIEIYEVP